jgi:hypothetical protein
MKGKSFITLTPGRRTGHRQVSQAGAEVSGEGGVDADDPLKVEEDLK